MSRLYFLTFFLVSTLSCQEAHETLTILESQKTLSFNSFDEFKLLSQKVSNMTNEELDIWEREKSFVSYRSTLNKAIEEWNLIESSTQIKLFEDKYQDILIVRDSTLIPKIDVRFLQAIVNREGIYETSGYLNKVIDDYVVSVPRSKYQIIKDIRSADQIFSRKLFNNKEVKVFQYTNLDYSEKDKSRSESTCSSEMIASFFANSSGCKNDREAFISAKSYYTVYNTYEGDWRQPRVQIKVWGTIRNWVCNWSSYATQLEYRNVSFTIMGWIRVNGNNVPQSYSYSLADYAPTNDRTELPWDQPIGDPALNQAISVAPFTSLHAEGKSRGIGENWAIIDCQ